MRIAAVRDVVMRQCQSCGKDMVVKRLSMKRHCSLKCADERRRVYMREYSRARRARAA